MIKTDRERTYSSTHWLLAGIICGTMYEWTMNSSSPTQQTISEFAALSRYCVKGSPSWVSVNSDNFTIDCMAIFIRISQFSWPLTRSIMSSCRQGRKMRLKPTHVHRNQWTSDNWCQRRDRDGCSVYILYHGFLCNDGHGGLFLGQATWVQLHTIIDVVQYLVTRLGITSLV